jgi:2OG-Fe(II) oxygenase superfamily
MLAGRGRSYRVATGGTGVIGGGGVGSEFFDEAVLESLRCDAFLSQRPFPWHTFEGALTPHAFDSLLAEFPRRELFEWKAGHSGQYYTRPHDRWYLEYRPHEPTRPGSARRGDLPSVWRRFVDELEGNTRYRALMTEVLGLEEFKPRLTWHLGVTGSEVSPHIDSDQKIGTHIFYFNTAADWDPEWGGNLVVLAGEPPVGQHPDRTFAEFDASAEVEFLGNRSFLFRNGPDSWHGVRPLTCPPGSYRRLFNVV